MLMSQIDWLQALDLPQAVTNVRSEFPGDWYRDPWGWPEFGFVLRSQQDILTDHLSASGTKKPAVLEVPKENWTSRPAMVLDPIDRLAYQAIVDKLSVDLIGGLTANAFGWRLPLREPKAGVYSHNNIQNKGYRSRLSELAGMFSVALLTDLTSFFASIPLSRAQDELESRCRDNAILRRLFSLLEGFDRVPERSGLPQRSAASAVIANMILTPVDDVLRLHSTSIPVTTRRGRTRYRSFVRWIDDIWVFTNESAHARRVQVELQRTVQSLGLHLNSGKTEVLEDEEVVKRAREVEHSAVDDALTDHGDQRPLEELVDHMVENPEHVGRTTVSFTTKRLRKHLISYRSTDLLSVAKRMPHTADKIAPVFKRDFDQGDLADWYIDYVNSEWSIYKWSVAQYGKMFASERAPSSAVQELFEGIVEHAAVASLPELAVAAQRLTAWDKETARAVINAAMRSVQNPLSRRVLALAALNANEARPTVRQWLRQDDSNRPTLAMLEARNFVAPAVTGDFAG